MGQEGQTVSQHLPRYIPGIREIRTKEIVMEPVKYL